MHRQGHIGASLLAVSPLVLVIDSMVLSVIVAGTALSVASLPDIDLKLPLVKHRGITHTLWFVLCGVGAVYGLLVWVALPEPIVELLAAAVGLSLLSHLLADAITPKGIKPLAPVSGYKVQLPPGVKASNTAANSLFLLVGVGLVFYLLTLGENSSSTALDVLVDGINSIVSFVGPLFGLLNLLS